MDPDPLPNPPSSTDPTTPKIENARQRREMLGGAIIIKNELLREGQPEKAWFGLGSFCVHVLSVAQKMARTTQASGNQQACISWDLLAADCLDRIREVIIEVDKIDRSLWGWEHFLTRAQLEIKTSADKEPDMALAISLLMLGKHAAERELSIVPKALITASLLSSYTYINCTSTVEAILAEVANLLSVLKDMNKPETDNETRSSALTALTGLHFAAGRAHKYLGVAYSQQHAHNEACE